jgi:hypothetical protein
MTTRRGERPVVVVLRAVGDASATRERERARLTEQGTSLALVAGVIPAELARCLDGEQAGVGGAVSATHRPVAAPGVAQTRLTSAPRHLARTAR